jgi:hypothetical protein
MGVIKKHSNERLERTDGTHAKNAGKALSVTERSNRRVASAATAGKIFLVDFHAVNTYSGSIRRSLRRAPHRIGLTPVPAA